MSQTKYRGYIIERGPAYTRDSQWQYVHEDYDGPEDNRIGLCATEADCRAEIDEKIEDGLVTALKLIVTSGCALTQSLRMEAEHALRSAGVAA